MDTTWLRLSTIGVTSQAICFGRSKITDLHWAKHSKLHLLEYSLNSFKTLCECYPASCQWHKPTLPRCKFNGLIVDFKFSIFHAHQFLRSSFPSCAHGQSPSAVVLSWQLLVVHAYSISFTQTFLSISYSTRLSCYFLLVSSIHVVHCGFNFPVYLFVCFIS